MFAALAALCLVISASSAQRDTRNLFNLTNPTYLRPDRYNQLLRIPDGLPLGDQGTQDTLFIWRNGLVTFGVLSSQANVTVPTRNYSEIDAEYLLAPLWFPNISTSLLNSTVSWEVEELTETDEDDEGSGSGSVDEESLLQFAEDTVYNYTTRNFGTPSDFSPTWAIVINWNVSLLPYYETHNICLAFYECQCRNFNEDYGSSNGYGSGPCRTEECYGVYGWSDNDIHYLDLICDLYISDIAVEFQLILATDGVNTYAASLYKCSYYYDDEFHLLQRFFSVGYRLGDQQYNNTCISSYIPSLLHCGYIRCDDVIFYNYRYFNFYSNSLQGLLWNLTNGFEEFRNLEPLMEGIDYIQFQLTDVTIALPRRLDGASSVIIHPGIGIGTTIQTNIYVGTNGIISFGRPFYFWYPQSFPTRYPWIREAYVAAPFWMDIDIRSQGDVLYSVIKREESPLIYNTTDTFLSYQINSTFTAEWILVALWLNVPVYPHYYVEKYSQYYSSSYWDRVLNDFNTFEAVLASSGGETYAIFTYNCELLTNPGFYRGAVIGFNLAGFEYLNNPFSESLAANRIACLNWPSSNWFNLVYKLNSGEDAILQARKECRRLVAEDDKRVQEKEILLYESLLSPCPCTIRNTWRDRNYRWDSENYYCYYRRLANPSTGQFDQYCCYDINPETWGALVKSGYRVSGMAELQENPWGRSVSQADLDMKRYCCGLADLCDLYLKRRPPNDCSGYQPPVWTWAWGDPHLTTLDGHSYTFNGYGEYVMLRYDGSLEFQARMRPTPGTQATQFSSFAIGKTGGGSRVEVNCDNPDPFCTTLYSGVDISSNLTNVNDSFYSSADVVEVVRETETTVTVVLGEGMALAVTYNSSTKIPSFQLTLDPGLTGSLMEGLLGNRDGDASNDLIAEDGDILDIDTASEQEIFDFGNTWLIEEADDSLFTYESDKGPADHHDASWTPLFYSDLTVADDVAEACTPEGATEPQQQCVFDAVATGDISVGVASMDTLTENTIAMTESTNLPPNITSSAEDTLILSPSSPISITLSVTDDNDPSISLSLLNTPPGSSLVLEQTGEYTFTWSIAALAEDEELSPIVFSAVDSQGAVSTYSPRVQVCACQNEGNCTLEGAASTSDNLIIMNCICSPAWEGRYCQLDVDGCLEYACIEGVECVDVPAPGEGAMCEGCPVGYTADGEKCADMDECAGDFSPCDQICTNTEGSYECSCNRGYITDPSDYSQCIDYDECGYIVDDCDQVCTNTDGSYQCSCRQGFISDGPLCTPEETCGSDYLGCGAALCAIISGTAECYCEPGFSLNQALTGCEDTDECEFARCAHLCTNLPGTYACSCDAGYALAPDLISCTDIDECTVASLQGRRLCSEGEVCLNEDGTYDCVCAPGTYRVRIVEPDNSWSTVCYSPDVNENNVQQSVTANFATTTDKELVEGGGLDTLSSLIVIAVERYCGENGAVCTYTVDNTTSDTTGSVARRKRDSHTIFDPSEDLVWPVFDILSVVSREGGGVSVSFYVVEVVSGRPGRPLNGSDTLAAVQSRALLFQNQFDDDVTFMLTYPPFLPTESPTPPSTDEEKLEVVIGVTAAVAVVAAVLAIGVALAVYLCVERFHKKKDEKSDLWTKGADGKKAEATEMTPKDPSDTGTTVLANEMAT